MGWRYKRESSTGERGSPLWAGELTGEERKTKNERRVHREHRARREEKPKSAVPLMLRLSRTVCATTCVEDLHLQAIEHARHTARRAPTGVGALLVILLCRVVSSSYSVLPPADSHRVSGVCSIVLLLGPVESSVPSGAQGAHTTLLLPGTVRRKENFQKSSKRTYPFAYLSFVL